MACDPEIVCQISISKFDHFVDRVSFVDIHTDTLFGRSLLTLSEDRWRAMRAVLTPAFTGNKIRNMFESIVDVVNDLIKNLANNSKHGKSIRWEMTDFFRRYSADVLAFTLFGVKIDSFENYSNDFIEISQTAFNSTTVRSGLRLFLINLLPKLTHALSFELIPNCSKEHVKSTFLNVMDDRKKQQIFRADMINILMKLRAEQLEGNWTDDDLVAQCFFCFFAGIDSTYKLLSFMAYELAINQNIQEKLHAEIKQAYDHLNGTKATFDVITQLKYLDQVVNETLRRWPPTIIGLRKCTIDNEIDLGGSTVNIERGTGIWISVSGLHNDPKYWNNPHEFDPERFSFENRNKIRPGSFLPFGIGPRNCIG